MPKSYAISFNHEELSLYGGNGEPEYLKHLSDAVKLESVADVEKAVGELLFCRNKQAEITRKIKTETKRITDQFFDEQCKLGKQMAALEGSIEDFYAVFPNSQHRFESAEIIDKHIIKIKPIKQKVDSKQNAQN
jgi:hypothetical protein